jgi:arsenate reductase
MREATMARPSTGLEILFLSRDDAVLGPMATALLNHWGRGRFKAASAGWQPGEGAHALTAHALRRAGIFTPPPHPRSWRDLEAADATAFRIVVFLGDEEPPAETPVWRGRPLVAQWSITPPAPGADDRAFERVLREVEARVKLLACLRWDELPGEEAERQLAAIDSDAKTS